MYARTASPIVTSPPPGTTRSHAKRPAASVVATSALGPGTVTAVHVAVGDAVSAGQPLLVLEAMKMQHPVVAGAPGVVRSLDVVPGAQVDAGTVLGVIEEDVAQ